MIIPETALLGVMQSGFAGLAQDATVLDDLFSLENPTLVSNLKSMLSNPATKVQVIMGFPASAPKIPLIGLTLAGSEETDQFVGSGHIESWSSVGNTPYMTDTYASTFVGTWRFTVYSPNAHYAVFLSYIVKNILIQGRDMLTGMGLSEQRVVMGDFEPIPEFLPDLVFNRAVMISAKTYEQQQYSIPFVPISKINVDIE